MQRDPPPRRTSPSGRRSIIAFAGPEDACFPSPTPLADGTLPDGLTDAWRSIGPPPAVWGRAELSAPLTPALTADLTDFDRSQIKYWDAETAGEVVFDHWD